MRRSLILSALGCLALLVSACSTTTEQQPTTEPQVVEKVVVRTVPVDRPKPIVPKVDPLKLRDVQWKIITADNVDTVFEHLSGDKVIFGVTAEGYEAIALNLSDIRAAIAQYQQIIAVYEKQ